VSLSRYGILVEVEGYTPCNKVVNVFSKRLFKCDIQKDLLLEHINESIALAYKEKLKKVEKKK